MITALAADEPEPYATGGVIPVPIRSGEHDSRERVVPLIMCPEPSGCTLTLPNASQALRRSELLSQPWLREIRDVTVSLASMTIYPREQAA